MGERPFSIKPGDTIEIRSLIFEETQNERPPKDLPAQTASAAGKPNPDRTQFIRATSEAQEQADRLTPRKLHQAPRIFRK